jgi:hypothetical protein
MKKQTLTFKNANDFKKFLYGVKVMPSQFNRPIKESHVGKMMMSVEKIGIQRAIIIIKTACFGEGVQLYFGDGQHLGKAILNIPVKKLEGHKVALINEINAVDEIIPFVSKMNSTASNWSMRNYLDAWVTHGLPDYKFLLGVHEETGYGISPLVEAYLNRRGYGNVTFKQGKFKANKAQGTRVISLYESAVALGLRKSNSSFLAFVRFVVDHSTLDEAHLLQSIGRNKSLFSVKFSRDGYLALLRAHCKHLN